MSCCALSQGTCKNDSRDSVDKIADPVNESADSVADTMDPSPICGESVESNGVAFDDFIDAKLTQAFGASILWSDGGGFVDPRGTWWICECHMCQTDSMTYLVEQWVMSLLICLLQRFGC